MNKMTNEIYEYCPNCGSIWGCEEFDFQECDCCGYPENNPMVENDEYDFFYDDFDDREDFYKNEIR